MRRRTASSVLLALAVTVAAAPVVPAASAGQAAVPAERTKIALPSTGRQLVLADLDGDGSDELLVVYGGKEGCRIGRLRLRTEAGHDSLQLEELPVGSLPPLIAPSPADADGDGTIDMLSVGPGGILLRRGLGDGRFEDTARLAVPADDLLMPLDGCEVAPSYVIDIEGDPAPEVVLPVVGGVRVQPLPVPVPVTAPPASPVPPAPGAPDPGTAEDSPAAPDGPDTERTESSPASAPPATGPAAHTLQMEPRVGGSASGVTLVSPLPRLLHGATGRMVVLGPVDDGARGRLELAWWSESAGGSLDRHRSALALPAGENAVVIELADLEDDGRPEVIVLSAPSHLEKLFGEWRLLVYHATDLTGEPVEPFFTAMTNINFWQLPSIATRPAPGGGDILIAFYRGLRTAHLTIERFEADGAGSFGARSNEIDLESGKTAERSLLIWEDVDSDGTADLVTGDDGGLRIHRGVDDRSQVVTREPFYVSTLPTPQQDISLSLQESGWSIGRSGRQPLTFFDSDGDGLSELFLLGKEESGGSLVEAGFLTPAGS